MSTSLNKRSLLTKVFQVSSFTLLSRLMGIVREALQARYLGVGAVSDAFITAFKIPNFFRKIFAEGALSASFIPQFVTLIREKRWGDACRFMSAAFLFFEGIVLILTIFVLLFTKQLVMIIAPGFSAEQMHYTIPYLQILFPFLFFVSSAALLAGALQSVNHFIIPSAASVMLNVAYIGSLLACIKYNLTTEMLCWGIVAGGAFTFAVHVWMYYKLGFCAGRIDAEAWKNLRDTLSRFIPFLLGASVVEINLFIDTTIGSYLPQGDVTLLYYAMRYAQMPLGIFALALSTVLLPHFSRIVLYARNRFNFYLLEVTKLITWVITPTMFFLMFVSYPIFSLIMLKGKASEAQMAKAAHILVILSAGLVVFSLHRSVINILYAVKDSWTPTWTSILAAVSNVIGNIVGMWLAGVYGIAWSTVASSALSLLACFIVLHVKHNIVFPLTRFLTFLFAYLVQLTVASGLFLWIYYCGIHQLAKTSWSNFFIAGPGYWLFTMTLFCFTMVFLFYSRKRFKVALYFLDM